MQINTEKFKAIAEAAKSRTNDKRWKAAIDKAVAGVVSGWWIITELSDSVAVTTETGQTYFANSHCQCRAYELGQPCKHRSLARLIELYNEAEAAPVAASLADAEASGGGCRIPISLARDVAATPRKNLIIEIENVWPKTWPPLYTELLARFGKSELEMLDDDMLRRVRLAVAM